MTTREIRVGADRLARWVAGFGERHGEFREIPGENRLELIADDGSSAVLHATYPPCPPNVPAIVENALVERTFAVLLVRRGGYGCAVVRGPQVLAAKVGSRYVQGRTAAGGWSQQRFARRRDNQAAGLASSAADVAARLLPPAGASLLVTGGDRALVEKVLADARLTPLRELPRGPHLEVGDPRADVIKALPGRLRAVRITVTG